MIPGLGAREVVDPTLTLRLRNVLVVDEALPIRRKLLDILHRVGVAATEVEMVETAEAALEAFALKNPTLVLCEFVGTPERGLEMVLEMLALDPQAKIVLITAEHPDSALVRAAIRAGVFGVVRKPLRHDAIRALLSEVESEEGGIERFR